MERKQKATKDSGIVKGGSEHRRTSLSLPLDLWRAAKIEAMDEGIDMADVITLALERYLSERKGGGR